MIPFPCSCAERLDNTPTSRPFPKLVPLDHLLLPPTPANCPRHPRKPCPCALTPWWREPDSNHRFRGGRARRFRSDFSVGGEPTRGDIERLVVSRGTDGSNPVPSSGGSVANPKRKDPVDHRAQAVPG